METVLPSKMLVPYEDTTQQHNPEDDLNLHHCENLESCNDTNYPPNQTCTENSLVYFNTGIHYC